MRETLTVKVYGRDGHRQSVSFWDSCQGVTWSGGHYSFICSDITGTNDYAVLMVLSETEEKCIKAIIGQIEDGAFENARVGRVELLDGRDFYEFIKEN